MSSKYSTPELRAWKKIGFILILTRELVNPRSLAQNQKQTLLKIIIKNEANLSREFLLPP